MLDKIMSYWTLNSWQTRGKWLEINTKWGKIKHSGRERHALKKKKSIFLKKYKIKRPRQKGWQTLKHNAVKNLLGRNHQGINEVVDSSGK